MSFIASGDEQVMRVLLVEDDPDLGAALQLSLKQLNYAIDWVKSAEQADTALGLEHFDCVLLDLTLPGEDGLTFLKRIRQQEMLTAVIILTAREAVEDRVKGLEYGADDYLPKPFDLSELNARIKAVYRRKEGYASNQLCFRELILDLERYQVFHQQKKIDLTQREFDLLKVLIESKGRLLSKAVLEEKLYSWSQVVSSNSVEVHIHNLRKKLPSSYIQTVRGLGYRIIENERVDD